MMWVIVLMAWILSTGKIIAQETPGILVQYHLWYSKEEKLATRTTWHGWSPSGWSVSGAKEPTVLMTPWRRYTSSRLGWPLVGAYSSANNLEKVRYDMGLIKQAGIDAVMMSVYDGSWMPIFENHFKIAQEVGVKVGLELYHGAGPDRESYGGNWASYPTRQNGCKVSYNFNTYALGNNVRDMGKRTGYYKIDGKPVFWLANAGYDKNWWKETYPKSDCEPREVTYAWGNVNELKELLAKVERDNGPVAIALSSGSDLDNMGNKFADIPQVIKIFPDGLSNIWNFYDLYGYENQISRFKGDGLTPGLNGSDYINKYQTNISQVKVRSGNKTALHVYPAFDERGLFPTTENRGSGIQLPRAVISRDGNGMYEKDDGFLKTALDLAKKNNVWVMLESWNDWNEQHQIEPGWTFNNFKDHGDYFSGLKRVAEFKNKVPVSFALPTPDIVDEIIIKSCRYKEWQGEKAKIFGKLKVKGEVKTGLFYLNDDLSYENPSYKPTTAWKEVSSVKGQGPEVSFNLDMTRFLDVPVLVWGVDALTTAEVEFIELKLNWYGEVVDLLSDSNWTKIGWHGVTMSQKKATLNPGQFIHGSLPWNNLASSWKSCSLTPSPTSTPIPTTPTSCGGVMETCCEGELKCGEGLECSGSNKCLKAAPSPVTDAPKVAGDANGDGVVNLTDLGVWKTEYVK